VTLTCAPPKRYTAGRSAASCLAWSSVPVIVDAAKRLLVGRPFRTEYLSRTLLPKRVALPVFASDALSSVAYAPDEILLTLAVGGLAAYTLSPWVALAVVVVLVVVVASYRQNVRAYPSGGGDYEVVTANLGHRAGVAVASALLAGYVLTVAVSISSAAQYAAAALPVLRGYETLVAGGVVVLLMAANLRGVRESGRALAVPTYVFLVMVLLTCVGGLFRWLLGDLPPAESAAFDVVPDPAYQQGLLTLGMALLVLRAFSSGAAALTGVQAVSNGVPTFREPKSRNAATVLALLAVIAAAMLVSVVALATEMNVRFVETPAEQLLRDGRPVGEDYVQDPVLSQVAAGVFDGFSPAFYLVAVATGLILVLAANTAFNGFPVLASILARDGLLPRQLHTRGDRLAFSNGILALAAAAVALIAAFDAEVTRLVSLYIVAIFVSFTASQLGMFHHWTERLRVSVTSADRRRIRRSRAVNAVGMTLTALVLLVVLVTRFTEGAWVILVAITVLYVLMRAIDEHYESVRRELAVPAEPESRVLPSRVHAVVLVAKIHKPTLRALAYARASRPSRLEALTVNVDPEETRGLLAEWERLGIPVPLKVLDSPYREVTRPVLDYIRELRGDNPRELVVVYVPEYVVGRWWEHLLHNQSALRLKSRLHFMPGVVVASVPWQLRSSQGVEVESDEVASPEAPGVTE
jgi:amino acid transporter